MIMLSCCLLLATILAMMIMMVITLMMLMVVVIPMIAIRVIRVMGMGQILTVKKVTIFMISKNVCRERLMKMKEI